LNECIPWILFIEDNPGDILLVRTALKEIGRDARLDTAQDGEAALGKLQALADDGSAQPDLILLDLNLPRVSGLELLEYIRSHRILSRIPAVVLTTSSAPRDRERCAELGSTDYLVKPARYEGYLAIARELEPLLYARMS
jgi:CheY-like chemotaxis protein